MLIYTAFILLSLLIYTQNINKETTAISTKSLTLVTFKNSLNCISALFYLTPTVLLLNKHLINKVDLFRDCFWDNRKQLLNFLWINCTPNVHNSALELMYKSVQMLLNFHKSKILQTHRGCRGHSQTKTVANKIFRFSVVFQNQPVPFQVFIYTRPPAGLCSCSPYCTSSIKLAIL